MRRLAMPTTEQKKYANSLWQGPYQDGLTQSMISYWLRGCPHRFYLKYVLGLSEPMDFNHKIEFGSMFHILLEHYPDRDAGEDELENYCTKLCATYPTSIDHVKMNQRMAELHFNEYCEHWRQDGLCSISSEEVFDMVFQDHESRPVRIRGKLDDVVQETSAPAGEDLWLMEHKTKGDIHEDIGDMVAYNLQSNVYFNIVSMLYPKTQGVIYNLIGRPLGNKHAPRARKQEKQRDFLKRVFFDYSGSSKVYPVAECREDWFLRYRIHMTEEHRERLYSQMIAPILTQICNWWDDLNYFNPFNSKLHYLRPLGLLDTYFNPKGEYYDLIHRGVRTGLVQTVLFREL
jgi:hypothetical protein